MSVFSAYARYYDLLYRDKDYPGETDFIQGLLREHAPEARELVELGSGSGRHAALLAERGYIVHGIDRSEGMLERAEAVRGSLPADVSARLAFTVGDVRDVRLGRKFDAALALFHVMSYQPANEDLLATLGTAREHLRSGGVFIFDCWYGPAVLSHRPTVRVKRMRDDRIEVTRVAEPTMHPVECLVDVHYTVFVRDLDSGNVEELEETHRMRYLFQPEVELLARSSGFEVTYVCEWMTRRPPSDSSWGVCFVLRA